MTFLYVPLLRISVMAYLAKKLDDMPGHYRKPSDTLVCLECGGEIGYGRRDRKFCSDKCKNVYHNREHHNRRSVQLHILGVLEKNYEILAKLLKADIRTVSIGDLSQLGFNKEFMTSYHKVGGHDEYRCYDIKYCCSPSKIFNIERVKLDY